MQIAVPEDEKEKRITSLIVAGETAVHLDNIPTGESLDSAALASLATAYPSWRGRLLGVSQTPSLPNSLTVVLSGNNLRASGEILKRTVPIVLRPCTDRPEDRTDFVHPDAEGYAASRHPEIVAVLLGAVEDWKSAGMPPAPHGRRLGGFERWSVTVGGILAHAGVLDWLGSQREWVRTGDDWSEDARALTAAWWGRHRDAEIRAKEVLALLQSTGTYPFVFARKEEGWLVVLAKRVLTPLVDRPVGEWRVVRVGSGSSSKYRLERTTGAGVSRVSGDV